MRPMRHILAVLLVFAATFAQASEHRGRVTFNGLPVPGATVTLKQESKTFGTVTDAQGVYGFADVADGSGTIAIEMLGFSTLQQPITIVAGTPASVWELKLLSLEEIRAQAHPATVHTELAAAPPPPKKDEPQKPAPVAQNQSASRNSGSPEAEDDESQRAADGLLINGSANNSSTSAFGLAGAFGNNRFGARRLYNTSLGFILGNSALDASPYSLAGQPTTKPDYNRLTGVINFGGPLLIPHVLKNGPFIFVGYQWTRNNSATTASALMPTALERSGVLSTPVIDPLIGKPFAANKIPENRISPQARALLNLYPLPNVSGNARYNYQLPLLNPTHQDALQTRAQKALGRNDQVFGSFGLQSSRSGSANVFGFLDQTSALGLNTNINWTHRLNLEWYLTAGVQFSRMAAHLTPNFANRENVSGKAGISGNNQDPANWGPPALAFSNGIASLSDGQNSFNRNQTSGFSYAMTWNRRAHNIAFGTDFTRRQYNVLAQQDPRGSFTFTGAATGSALGDFLLGIPSTSSIAFGNPDKYFRQSLYDGYFADDWRVRAGLTLNAGVRWEYGAPVAELHDRLVNLDIARGFTSASPVVASSATGSITGQHYPNSLVHPDKSGVEPRIGIAWKPIPGSSLVVRAGYGIYRDTSVYQTLASQMSQQPPLSKTFSVQNSAATPLTLANGFNVTTPTASNTFAIDPNFRVGYAQNWQVSAQRDLPFSMQMTATYLGIKGTHALQALLPNTYPLGGVNPCPACPSGFVYLTSGANSSREAAQIQLRRRLHSGFGGSLQYTFSRSIDNAAALGGPGASSNASASAAQGGANPSRPIGSNLMIAQNWLDLAGERGLSTFDQRHVLSAQAQYTTGMGLAGGTLLSGWRGGLLKDWTFVSQVSAGSGLPQSPVYLAPVPGTGVTGTIRPNYTGASIYSAPAGLFLNPAAYAAPASGQWGNAGRDSIRGPLQFNLNGSLARTFRVRDRYSLDLRFDAANLLNHVTYPGWNTTINSAQFGLPVAANAMRTMQTTLRLRF